MKKLLLLTIALFTLSGVWAAKTVYLEPNIWATDNPAYAVYAWGGATDPAFYDVEPVTGTTYFKATIPDDRTGVIFTRAENATKAKDWNERWNQTVDITLPAENSAAYIITGWDGGDGKSTIKYSAKFPNYALIGTASASTGTAANAIDGDTGTRWESASTDSENLIIDLGAVKTFNTVSIMWEGAYSKSFTIEVSTDGENYTEAAKVTDQTLAGFPYVQNIQFEAKTAQYVKFQAIKRATGYGNSFWEFGVYNLADPLTLTTLTIKTDKTSIPVGGTTTLTATGRDQLGGIIATDGLTWESSAPAVGTIDAGVLTGVSVGTTTVTAKKGTIVSNGVEVEIVAGEKIDLFTNWISRIYTLGDDTKAASRDGMVDNNDGSLWILHGTTGADETSRTYDTGFIVDLGAIYDVTKISIHFEGACSENFGLAFAGVDGVFGDNVYTGGKTGINNHTEEFSGESVTNARYVKFLSTKASSEWGVKIYDFSVYGIKKSDIEDTEAPTVNASEAAKTEESITLTLTGTDNSSKYLTYEVAANDIPATYFFGPAGANTTAVFSNLNGGTTYNFAIYSIDGKGNRSAIKELSVTTTGEAFVLTPAPAPTKAAANVKSIYSDAYTPATTYEYGTWGQSTQVATETVEEDNILHLTNFNYLGFVYATDLDLSDMEYVHIDILPMQAMDFGITPILRAAGSGTATEKSQSVGALNVKEWNSIDIPLTQFAGMDFTQLSHQLKIDKGTGTLTVYVDNIYFWKESGDDNEKPVMVSAALASKTHNSATLTLEATDNNSKVKFHIVDATNNINVTTGLADQGTDFEYTVTGLTAETAYNFTVTAEDAAGNVSENNKDVAVTTDAAPTGQELVSGDHKILLNGYHDIGTENYELIITSDEVMQGLGGSFWNINGVGGTRVDANLVRSADGKTLTITATSNQDPQLYTPLYVMMPGEVNFGQPTIIWQERGAAPTPTEGYYIIGNMNDWEINNNYKLTLNEAAAPTVEYYFPSLALTTTSQFKVVYSADGTDKTIYYPDGTENDYGQHGEITADGNYTIFFRPNGDGGSDWFHNVIYVTSMIDAGADPTTGAHILQGVWDADKFASIDAMDKAAAYDLTQLSFTGQLDMIGKTANPYCMFITSAPGKVNRNEVVWDEANSRYNGFAMYFAEPADATAPFDINTSIAPIHVVNPFFQRMFTSANNYFTMTIPFNYTLPATDKAWTMSATSSESGLSVTFTEVAAGSTLTKNTPYLYFSSAGGVTMPNPGEVIIDWAAQTVDETDASFVANYSRKVTDGTENIYVLPGVVKETALQFQKAGEVSIRPFRAYLQAASAPAKINVMFDDATGIHAATAEQLEGIFNIYSIDGKLVRQNGDKMGLNKGVYIINGKKVVVK